MTTGGRAGLLAPSAHSRHISRGSGSIPSSSTCTFASGPAYLPVCLPTYLCARLPAYLPASLPAYLPALPTSLPPCLPSLPTYLPTYLPPSLPAYLCEWFEQIRQRRSARSASRREQQRRATAHAWASGSRRSDSVTPPERGSRPTSPRTSLDSESISSGSERVLSQAVPERF